MEKKFFARYRVPLLIFTLFFITYSYFDFATFGWNVNSRLGLTRAIVEEGTFQIDNYHLRPYTSTGDKAYHDGHYYSDKAIGSSILGVAVYAPFHVINKYIFKGALLPEIKIGYLVKVGVVALPSAIFAAFLFIWITKHGISRKWALTIVLLYGLGTMSLPYSTLLFGHQLAAIMSFGAFMLAERLTSDKNKPPGKTGAFFVGFIGAYSLITEYTTGLLIIPVCIYYLWRLPWRTDDKSGLIQAAVLPFIGGFIPLGILMYYNAACFGTPFTLGYKHMADAEFATGMSKGLMGIYKPNFHVLWYLSFHHFRGLFFQSPWLLVGLTGWYALYREKKHWWLFFSVWSFISFMMLACSYYMWWGGATFGVRHFIPAMVFTVLPAFFVRGRILRSLILVLGLISVVHMLLLTYAEPRVQSFGRGFYKGLADGWSGQTPLVENQEKDQIWMDEYKLGYESTKSGLHLKYSPVIFQLSDQNKTGKYQFNWGTVIGLKGIYSLLPLIIFILALTLWLYYPFKEDS